MNIKPIKTRIFEEGENLVNFILRYLPKIKDKSVIVITSKIVALAEKRTSKPARSRKCFERLIRSESEIALKSKPVWFTIKNNMLSANAGIDISNGNGKLILLPRNSFGSATKIRRKLLWRYKIKNLGVIITDSIFLPFRSGITAASIGYAGLQGLRDHRGKKDIFGRRLKLAKTNVVDSIACVCAMLMGEGGERMPLALVENAPVKFIRRTNHKELFINPKEDLYKPFFEAINKNYKK